MEKKTIKAMEKELEQAKQQAAAERRTAAKERQKKYRDKQLAAGKLRLTLWVQRADAALLRAVLTLSEPQKTNLMQAIRKQRQAHEKKPLEPPIEGPERANSR